MAKNFPFFKFTVTEWMTGDIVYEEFSTQGLFINICALYWQRDGVLSLEEINKRYKKPKELDNLIDNFLFIDNGLITIKFLDEQLIDANHISKTNSKNGSLGGRPKKRIESDGKAVGLISLSEKKRTESEPKAKKSKEEQEEEKEQEKEEINNALFSDNCKNSTQWINVISENKNISTDAVVLYLGYFEKHLISMQEQKKYIKDFKEHFVHWLNKQNLSIHKEKTTSKTNQSDRNSVTFIRDDI